MDLPSPESKTVAITVPSGKVVRVEHDLPFGVVADIATRHNVQWMALVGSPLLCPGGALLDLYVACCAHVGEAPPELINSALMETAVNLVGDDMPTYFEDHEDGNGPLPKAEQPTTP